MQIVFRAALALGAIVSLSGCATVINGTSQTVKVRTDPKGAVVTFNNGLSCTSPCKVDLKRRNDSKAKIVLPGYKPTYVLIQSRTGGAMAGNILLGGLIGGVVDGANGASNFLAPSPLNVKLAPADSVDEPMLLDKKNKPISTVAAFNEKVREDVSKTIGRAAAGYEDDGSPPAASAPATAAAPAPAEAPAAATPATATPAPAKEASAPTSAAAPTAAASAN